MYQLLRYGIGRGGDITWKGWSSGRYLPLPLGLARGIHLPVPTRALHGLWRWTGMPAPETLLGGADVVHGTNYVLPPLRKARGILSIYDLAFLVHPAWSSAQIRRHLVRGIVADARRAHAVVTCSTYSRGEITRWCGVSEDRIHVIYGAADPLFTPAETVEARRAFATQYGIPGPYVLYVGTLEPRKNVFTLLKAFARIPRSVRATLVLAGGMGWGMESLEDALRKTGVADRVIRTGYLPDRETVRDACRGAACFAMPSWCEGFGLPLLEAMACGCACVASNASALPEVGGEGVRYVDPADEEGLSVVLREWLEDEGSRETWGRRALDASRRFSWEASASGLLELYERVAACAC